jgi:hypothetical protein
VTEEILETQIDGTKSNCFRQAICRTFLLLESGLLYGPFERD